jgi:hypothetical protein
VKWDLPSTCPMVDANYAAQRSALAKNSGFGLREKPVAVPANTRESEVLAAPSASRDDVRCAGVYLGRASLRLISRMFFARASRNFVATN